MAFSRKLHSDSAGDYCSVPVDPGFGIFKVKLGMPRHEIREPS